MNALTMAIVPTLLLILCASVAAQSRRSRGGNGVCPDACFCNPVNKIVYCSRRGLTSIPRSLPDDSQQLNMNGNLFEMSLIQRSNFTNLESLEHLYLSECGIERIEVSAFAVMVNLKWLDLSNNRIARIEDYTFSGLSLMHLFLNGNRNLRLDSGAFIEMQTTGLYLHECSLSRLSFNIFEPLNGTLQNVWLHGNEIEVISKDFKPLFSKLLHLRLGQNPLHCNCESLWLKEFFDTRRQIFEGATVPSCLSPEKLRGAQFDQVSVLDFQCMPPVFLNIDAVVERERGVLTCRAQGDPAPTLYWISPSGMSNMFRPQKGDIKQTEAVIDITHRIQAGLDISGQYFCFALNEGGNMTFTFNISMPRYSTSRSTPSPRVPTVTNTQPSIPIDKIDSLYDDSEDTLSSQEIQDIYRLIHEGERTRESSEDWHHSQVPHIEPGSDYSANDDMDTYNHHETHPHNQEVTFTLLQLIVAVVGTFLCTVLVCVLTIPLILRLVWSSHRQNIYEAEEEEEKPPLKHEAIYTAPIEDSTHYIGKMPPRAYRGYYFESACTHGNRSLIG